MEVIVLGVPTSDGTGIRGCELAPQALRGMGLESMIGKYRKVRDLGDAVPLMGLDKNTDDSDNKTFNYNRVIDFNCVVAEMAIKYARAEDFTLFLGGDHSISAGSIAGRHACFPDTAVIWIDAHADLNTYETSPSKNAHGMSAAALLGAGHLTHNFSEARISEKNLFLLGQRGKALDGGEISLIGDRGIFIRTWDEIQRVGVRPVLEGIIQTVKKNADPRIHLSFDIDVVSGSLVTGTGTPVDGGPDVSEVKEILRILAQSGLMRSMDFVEFNPLLDKDGKTALLCMELLEEVFKYLV